MIYTTKKGFDLKENRWSVTMKTLGIDLWLIELIINIPVKIKKRSLLDVRREYEMIEMEIMESMRESRVFDISNKK